MSPLPATLDESGLSDVEGQVRWRWNFESAKSPEFFNYFEYVFPTGEKNSLIGTSDWEFKLVAVDEKLIQFKFRSADFQEAQTLMVPRAEFEEAAKELRDRD